MIIYNSNICDLILNQKKRIRSVNHRGALLRSVGSIVVNDNTSTTKTINAGDTFLLFPISLGSSISIVNTIGNARINDSSNESASCAFTVLSMDNSKEIGEIFAFQTNFSSNVNCYLNHKNLEKTLYELLLESKVSRDVLDKNKKCIFGIKFKAGITCKAGFQKIFFDATYTEPSGSAMPYESYGV